MFTTLIGYVVLIAVCFVSVIERQETKISFFDWHAAIVVVGGVIGSLLVAFSQKACGEMLKNWLSLILGRDQAHQEIESIQQEMNLLQDAWRDGRRSTVLQLIEDGKTAEIRVAAETLVQQLQGERLAERFSQLRASQTDFLQAQVEGWDLVARLAPSFGIVGTVTGMVQLFRNLAGSTGHLGGAMAMALLATLYGILLGTAIGGPMSSRVNHQLNERLNVIDLLERKVAALVEEDRLKMHVGARA